MLRTPRQTTLHSRFNGPARAFDPEVPRGTLKRFNPEFTEVVDVAQVAD